MQKPLLLQDGCKANDETMCYIHVHMKIKLQLALRSDRNHFLGISITESETRTNRLNHPISGQLALGGRVSCPGFSTAVETVGTRCFESASIIRGKFSSSPSTLGVTILRWHTVIILSKRRNMQGGKTAGGWAAADKGMSQPYGIVYPH